MFRLRAPGMLAAACLLAAWPGPAVAAEVPVDARAFRVVPRESGPRNYYRVVEGDSGAFIRGAYRPPLETVLLGFEVPDGLRRARELRWRWRALVLPAGADECVEGRGDSAASVYVTWKRGLRWYTLKYVWTSLSPRGAACNGRRNPFVAQDTVVLESGPPTGVWKEEGIDLHAAFRRHFEAGDPEAEVPDLVGIGILVDGDQTGTVSAADLADFRLDGGPPPPSGVSSRDLFQRAQPQGRSPRGR